MTNLDDFLNEYKNKLWSDLGQCLSQTTQTTKHDRRGRTLAYLLENITSFMIMDGVKEQDVINLIVIIDDLKFKIKSHEGKISLDRASKRLSEILNNPSKYLFNAAKQCIACNEFYKGKNHICTNKTAKGKDAIMGYDDTVSY